LSLRPRQPEWELLSALPEDAADVVTTHRVNGSRLAVLRMGEQLYAYRDACPSCGGSLAGSRLRGDMLDCPGCGRSYDVRHAGQAAGDHPGLDPVPLLQDQSGVRVAIGALR
jgi:nitrite reductase/ring-hydroxylating ferredoxin subunit